MYEMKTSSPFDATEYDQFEFRLFIEMGLLNQSILAGQFTETEIGWMEKMVAWFDDSRISEMFENAKDNMKKQEETWNGALTNYALEQKASTIKIDLFVIEDIWQVAVNSLKEIKAEVGSSD